MFALPPIRFSSKCKRCGLRYPKKAQECKHCSGLSDAQMDAMLFKKREAHENTANLGRLFLYITVVMFIGFLIFIMT